ncbi:MAG: hypothetical protein AAFP79_12300 [Pseudomonadota bacterium]
MVEKYEVQVVQDSKTGIVCHEGWRLEGDLHRVGAPALIQRDSDTGVIFHENWYQCGLLHRDNGPAEVIRDRKSGTIIQERYFRFGSEVEPNYGILDGPAI